MVVVESELLVVNLAIENNRRSFGSGGASPLWVYGPPHIYFVKALAEAKCFVRNLTCPSIAPRCPAAEEFNVLITHIVPLVLSAVQRSLQKRGAVQVLHLSFSEKRKEKNGYETET